MGTASAPPVAAQEPAATRSKPASPIGLGYELLGDPLIGQALEIRITSRSSLPMSNLMIDVRGDQELMLSAESQQFFSAQVEADEPTLHVVTVTPLYEGLHYLSVTAQAMIDGQVQADYVTISIRVGDAEHQSEPMGTLETDDTGEAIISLPAEGN
ncbi:MAG: hypothetical protein ACR2QQ_10975 [Gammaproteobacteria bacterium]